MKAIFKVYEEETLEDYFKKEITWTLSEKLEYSIDIQNQTKIINFSDIDNVKLILFSSTNNETFKVRISTSTDTITFTVDDVFIFTPTDLTINNITEIALIEEAGIEVEVKAIFYGESLES